MGSENFGMKFCKGQEQNALIAYTGLDFGSRLVLLPFHIPDAAMRFLVGGFSSSFSSAAFLLFFCRPSSSIALANVAALTPEQASGETRPSFYCFATVDGKFACFYLGSKHRSTTLLSSGVYTMAMLLLNAREETRRSFLY
jgi:hypothetical protein